MSIDRPAASETTAGPARGRPRASEIDARVIAAARELFAAGGYGAVTIAGVATRAGLPRSTVYRRYATATALRYAALVLGGDTPPPAETGDARIDLEVHIATNARAFIDPASRELLREIIADSLGDAPGRELLATRYIRPRLALIASMIERAQQRGEIPDHVDGEVAAMAITGVLIYRSLLLDEPIDDALLRKVLDLVVPPNPRRRR